ncbi:hypothetical protein FKW77_004670 [Venturia effusa]|uniref:RING-type domain-containing protein n=1 Tax=Venturia effusa TaxID=50376 RepID=A0A517KW84_9PEZI|nr:hypothetical protein FKW77_004670 [Venturia effusa]
MASHKSFDSSKSSSRGSRDSLVAKAPTRKSSQEASSMPALSSNDQAWHFTTPTLKSEFDTLRSLITCKICYGLLYEPYTTSCGHTYCYTCLCKSFKTHAPQSCPECRTRLHEPPAPAFLVRELTHSIVRKVELLPPDETLEQHTKWQKEHADDIQQDKDNPDPRKGGLWKGFFRRVGLRIPRSALRDVEDGVDRCPYCSWELEEGMCERCGLPFDENGTGVWENDGLSELSSHGMLSEHGGELDVDLEIDMADDAEFDEFDDEEQAERDAPLDEFYRENGSAALQRFLEYGHDYGVRRPAAHSAAHSRRRSYSASIASDAPSEMHTLEELEEEEEEEEEDDDSSMNDFIEPDDRPLSVSGSTSSSTYTSSSRASVEPVIIEEDEDEDDEDATEDEGPVPNGRRRRVVTDMSATVAHSGARVRAVSELTDDSQPVITSRNRRVISETPPSVSTATAAETEGEEEDELPVPVGRRRRRDTAGDQTRRVRPRQRRSSVESSATSNAASTEISDHPDNWVYERLHGQQPNDEEDLQWGDESDGGRTTVGWEPITNSIERNRNTGSLTPIADRPNALRRPLSRTGPGRYPQVLRTLRRRGSTISANDHYEDNDADDDVSETDQQGDTSMIRPRLRQQNSRIRLRHTISRPLLSRAQPVLANQDNESDDTDLSSQSAQHEQLIRQREYNPVFGQLFAQHQNDLQVEDVDSRPPFAEFEHLRTLARTPLARPRTGNRNRITGYPIMPSPGPFSRATPLAHNTSRYRVTQENTSNASASSNTRHIIERPASGSLRTPLHSNSNSSNSDVSTRINTPSSETVPAGRSSPTGIARTRIASQTMSPMQAARAGDLIERPASRLPASRAGDNIERPASRVNSRPPSAAGRRGSAGRMPFSAPPPLSPMAPGLNTARTWQHNNPFFNARAASIRPRQSSQRLREQSSTATLRARDSTRTLRQQPSVVNVREVPEQSPLRARGSNRTLRQWPSQMEFREEADVLAPQVRPQASRLHLRPQPSSRRLHQTQLQGQLMREAALARMLNPNQPDLAVGQRYSPNTVPTLSEDERRRRANELVRRRALELAEERINERHNNPFQRRPRPAQSMSSHGEGPADGPPPGTNANRSAPVSNTASSSEHGPGLQPTLGRRRSSRSLAPVPQNGFTPASVLHSANTGSIRARLGALPGRNGHEPHVPTGMARGIAALTAGGDFRHN